MGTKGNEAAGLAPLPYYKWHWQRFRANRRVQRMDYIARGLYRELLDEQWADGSISSELEELADICGCPVEVMREKWPQIAGCFTEREDGRLFNQVLEEYRTSEDGVRVKRKSAGRAGGIQKLANAKQVLASAKQVPSNCHIEEKSREDKRREEKDSGAAPSGALPAVASKVIGTLPLIDKTDYEITQAFLDEWQSFYPAIQVKQQLMSMKAWLIANPKNMKTRSGIVRFIDTWLKKEQNRAPRVVSGPGGSNGNNRNDNRSPAQRRQDNSFAAIDAAFESFGLGPCENADEADEGGLSESGVDGGNGADLDSALAHADRPVRTIDVPGVIAGAPAQ